MALSGNSTIITGHLFSGRFPIVDTLSDDVVRLVILTHRGALGPVGRRSTLSLTLLLGKAIQRQIRQVYVVHLASQNPRQRLHGFVPLDDQLLPVG